MVEKLVEIFETQKSNISDSIKKNVEANIMDNNLDNIIFFGNEPFAEFIDSISYAIKYSEKHKLFYVVQYIIDQILFAKYSFTLISELASDLKNQIDYIIEHPLFYTKISETIRFFNIDNQHIDKMIFNLINYNQYHRDIYAVLLGSLLKYQRVQASKFLLTNYPDYLDQNMMEEIINVHNCYSAQNIPIICEICHQNEWTSCIVTIFEIAIIFMMDTVYTMIKKYHHIISNHLFRPVSCYFEKAFVQNEPDIGQYQKFYNMIIKLLAENIKFDKPDPDDRIIDIFEKIISILK